MGEWVRAASVTLPERQRVGENDVTVHMVRGIVRDIESGVELESFRDVAGEPRCGEIVRAALKIELNAPRRIEVVRPARHDLGSLLDLDRTANELVVLGIVAGFQERLRFLSLRRPVDEARAQEERLALDQTHERAEDLLLRRDPLEQSGLEPPGQAELGLQLIRVGDLTALRLEAERELSLGLDV